MKTEGAIAHDITNERQIWLLFDAINEHPPFSMVIGYFMMLWICLIM